MSYPQQTNQSLLYDPTISLDEDKVEKLLLLITWVSFFNCIMKMDYNAAVYLFLYFLWTKKEKNQHYKAFFYANIAFLISDLIWLIANMGAWSGTFDENFSIWLSFRAYRIFTLIMCVFIIILKIALLYFQNKVLPASVPQAHVQAAVPYNQNNNMYSPAGQNFTNNPNQSYNGQPHY